MPGLDVSFMVLDPMFADTFDVVRRTETISNKGRPVVQEELTEDVVGVVTQESPDDLLRTPDAQRVPRKIVICTKFALRGATNGFQPDVVRWNGSEYTVTEVLPYSRFGQGTYQVIAQTTVAMDEPQ